jgi:pimeloyl-ACP methyl ester carboxylesterase
MQRSRLVAKVGLLLICVAVPAGCGGRHETVPPVHVLRYRPGLPLHAQVTDGGRQGSLRLEKVTYTSVDGSKVPALFAVPTGTKPLGCLIYQGGLGQTKEQFPQLRAGAAALRLATFTIDPRNTGARGSAARIRAAVETPETLAQTLGDTVVDLRMGLDYLETRRDCHHNVGYLGTSFGGVLGVLLAAQDPRIKAVVLTSIGATFKESMLVSAAAAQHDSEIPVIVPGAASDPALLAHAVRVLGAYDPVKWIGRIAPRPLMLINGRFDPVVTPVDALELAAAARRPKTVLYFDGGHNPFAPGPDEQKVVTRLAEFLSARLGLPGVG